MKLQDFLQKLFSKAKIQKQLYGIYALAVLIPLVLICSLVTVNSASLLTEHFQGLVNSDNTRIKSILFDVTTNFCNQSEDLASDQSLITLLETEYQTGMQARQACDEYARFNTILKNEPSINAIHLYTLNKSLGDYGNIQYATPEITSTSWFQGAQNSPNLFWRSQTRTDIYKNIYYELTLYRRVTLPHTKSFAVLAITMSGNYLKSRIENNTLSTMLAVNQGPVFYSTDRGYAGKPLPFPVDFSSQYYTFNGKMKLDNRFAMSTVSSLQPYRTNDKLYIASFDYQAYPSIHEVIITYTIMGLISLLIPFLLIFLFTRYFSARVNTLRSAIHRASNSDYDIEDSFHGDDEISEAFRDLQLVIAQIKEKEAQMYEAQLGEQRLMNRQQEMEFKMLASQINPHFLYNTLETIRMKAFTEGNRGVATAIKLLGKSMHYVLENTGTASTTLQKELDYIDTYVSIQRLRFGDRVSYTLDVQEGVRPESCQILPLLLQPIVENAISHGLEGISENGQIILSVRQENKELLLIDVSDNGIGMPAETLAALQKSLQKHAEEKSASIGLSNISQRIRLCYGNEYKMEVTSQEGAGTRVSLALPLQRIQEERE